MKTSTQKYKTFKSKLMSCPFKIIGSLVLLIGIASSLNSCSPVHQLYKVVFWYDESVADHLLYEGTDTLKFNIYGNVFTASVDDNFWTTAPSCNDPSAPTKEIQLLPKNSHIWYSVSDESGFIYVSDTCTLVYNTCNTIKIVPTKYKEEIVH